MGRKNYPVEGVSCSGKNSVCEELQSRGYQAIHRDRELAYQGNPQTGEPVEDGGHECHLWDIKKVRYLAQDRNVALSKKARVQRSLRRFAVLLRMRPPRQTVPEEQGLGLFLKRLLYRGRPGVSKFLNL